MQLRIYSLLPSTVVLLFAGLCMVSPRLQAQQKADKAVVSGYVTDASNGEALIGATVYIAELDIGTITNAYGFYSLSVKKGTRQVRFSYVGFISRQESVSADKNIRLDVALDPTETELEEVVIEGEESADDIKSVEMSTNTINIGTISKMPSFIGEPDVLKSILMLPGVSTVGEGAAGYNVRGGSVGQNVILLDEAPVYNSSHVFGFFSVFNPDAVRDVKLYKGAIPSRYGGRLASVLDIRMKEGNNKRLGINGGVGTVFSRIAVEAPIVKDKGSFLVAARRSYFDVFTRLFSPDLADARLYFYDITLKANYTLNPKNKLYLSGYFGQDVFRFDGSQGFDWGNTTGSLRWSHLFGDRLFSNTTFVYSNYNYRLIFEPDDENSDDGRDWRSSISNFTLKPEFSYFLNSNNEITFGGDLTYYSFRPAEFTLTSDDKSVDLSLDRKFNLEAAAYVGNKQDLLGNVLSLEYGLRFSYFQAFGPGAEYQYIELAPGLRKVPGERVDFGSGEPMSSYSNLEPRVSFRVQVSPKSSIKGSYNRMAQYLHLISNAAAANPLNVWVPTSNNIKPELGDQFTLGYFRDLGKKKTFDFSVEGYYRKTQNQVGYIDGADILLNEYLEGDLLSGDGRAYGVEFYLQKKTGRLSGWLSYTLGRTELQIPGISNGEWYPTRFDQTHNLKLAAFYDINKRVSISTNFVYLTGTPTTFPTSRYWVGDQLIYHNAQQSRNNLRIPAYHRLDVSVRLKVKKVTRKGRKRKLDSYWDFALYNVYARRNPFSVTFTGGFKNDNTKTVAKQLAIIGFVIPSISWNFKFINDKK